jgi:hypothetical protein
MRLDFIHELSAYICAVMYDLEVRYSQHVRGSQRRFLEMEPDKVTAHIDRWSSGDGWCLILNLTCSFPSCFAGMGKGFKSKAR